MGLILSETQTPITLRLSRDLVRLLKRGNPWVFREALRECPAEHAPGTHAVLLDNKRGRVVARGFYDPASPVAFRACNVDDDRPLDDAWAVERFLRAWKLRQRLFGTPPRDPSSDPGRLQVATRALPTTGFRLLNGEGDGVPGLVVDLYSDTAVVKLDGAGPAGFWHVEGIADWLVREVGMDRVVARSRGRGSASWTVAGPEPIEAVPFLEYGINFTADVLKGQKTGFFLDQRDNRFLVRSIAAGLTVLNLFGYTGGFSVCAGIGGAVEVTTVDRAEPAIAVADDHWRRNGLPEGGHQSAVCDVFEFLAEAQRTRRRWDLVISDPPSFAPSQADVERALSAYRKLAAACASVTARGGLLALASCSSHVSEREWMRGNEDGISQAHRRGTVLGLYGQPPDHPSPLVLSEFRYLKFALLQLD